MALRFLLLSPLVLGSSQGMDGGDDAQAAFQSAVEVHRATAAQLGPEGPSRSPIYLNFEDGIGGAASAVAQILERALPAPEGKVPEVKSSKQHKVVQFTYKMLQHENGTGGDLFQLDHGCERKKDGTTICDVDMDDRENVGLMDFDLAGDVDDTSSFSVNVTMDIDFMFGLHSSGQMSCPACGHNCTMKMFNFPMEAPAYPCPLKSGKYKRRMAFSELPMMPKSLPGLNGWEFKGRSRMVRSNGAVIFEFEFGMKQ
uniref:Uncharacterized protein n=1 Tax=Alexandrium catenella TaxID=2925 RepID=A0A7S1RN22_ALECA